MKTEENKAIMDTHMHSKASDGLWDPAKVIEHAKESGLEIIALTDHDSVYGIPEALEAGSKQGIKVIPGVEIDSSYDSNGKKVSNLELLGLNINPIKIQPWLQEQLQKRLQSVNEYISSFNSYVEDPKFEDLNAQKQFQLQDVAPISLEEIVDWKNEKSNYHDPAPAISKMDIVYYIADKFAKDSESFDLLKKGDRPAGEAFKSEYAFILKAKQNRKSSFYESIKAVKDADGIAVIAHPGLSKGYKDGMVKEWELPQEEWFKNDEIFTPYHFAKDLKEHGLDGVELYHYEGSDAAHAKNQDLINHYFASLANKLGLITTKGSDCHGPKGNGPMHGKFGANKEEAEKIMSQLYKK